VAVLIQVQRATIDTLPFLDLLLFGAIKELLHRILEVEGIVVAVDVVAAVLVVGGNVSVDGAFLRLDEVIAVVLHLLFLVIFFLMLFLVLFIFFLVILGLLVVII